MKQIIVFTGYNRPWYMGRVLDSWSKVRGIGAAVLDFHLEPGVEPSCLEVAEQCRGVRFAEAGIHMNQWVRGVQRNPWMAINCGFERTPQRPDDFVILAEDDFIVATDILEWFTWARQAFYTPLSGDLEQTVLAVSAKRFEEQGGPAQACLDPFFPGWIWGTWRDRWEQLIRDDWTFNYEHRGWDWRLTQHWCEERGMVCASPGTSRSQHIGEYGGVHTRPGASFFDDLSRCFTPEIAPQDFQLPRVMDGRLRQ